MKGESIRTLATQSRDLCILLYQKSFIRMESRVQYTSNQTSSAIFPQVTTHVNKMGVINQESASVFPAFTQCLKITEKVAFNIYIFGEQKLIKNGQFWRVFENLKLPNSRHFYRKKSQFRTSREILSRFFDAEKHLRRSHKSGVWLQV